MAVAYAHILITLNVALEFYIATTHLRLLDDIIPVPNGIEIIETLETELLQVGQIRRSGVKVRRRHRQVDVNKRSGVRVA
jgi:hypothetical protein